MRVTLSLGEQTEDTYKRWFDAGARRYLLRIESSHKELYKKIHPDDCLWDIRMKAIRDLKKIGYQTGTGVMIGLPWQSLEILRDDVMFYKKNDIDMIGMGPYLTHPETPLADAPVPDLEERKGLALKMIAVSRIVLKDVNIASTTALETIREGARKEGIIAGANVIMPNITPPELAGEYNLYVGKPKPASDLSVLSAALKKLSESLSAHKIELSYKEWGDSLHFKKKAK